MMNTQKAPAVVTIGLSFLPDVQVVDGQDHEGNGGRNQQAVNGTAVTKTQQII